MSTSLEQPSLRNPAPRRRGLEVSILGTGACLPQRVVSNRYFTEELGLDTTEEWIAEKTGILERRFAEPDVTTSQLATEAGLRALEQALVPPDELELIVVATSTPDYLMPSTACLVQRDLAAVNAAAMDVNAACAGFAVALHTVIHYLNSTGGTALVIGADLGSRLVDPHDRSTSIFFGDGAGAAVISAGGSGRVLASRISSRGRTAPLTVPVGGTMSMDGRSIWEFATRVLPKTITALCAEGGIDVSELALLVPHQANANIIRHSGKQLGLRDDQLMINLDRYGNTVAASIPIALAEAVETGRVGSGDYVAIAGFGAGLSWGGSLLQL